jgi:hypothetical protein
VLGHKIADETSRHPHLTGHLICELTAEFTANMGVFKRTRIMCLCREKCSGAAYIQHRCLKVERQFTLKCNIVAAFTLHCACIRFNIFAGLQFWEPVPSG